MYNNVAVSSFLFPSRYFTKCLNASTQNSTDNIIIPFSKNKYSSIENKFIIIIIAIIKAVNLLFTSFASILYKTYIDTVVTKIASKYEIV